MCQQLLLLLSCPSAVLQEELRAPSRHWRRVYRILEPSLAKLSCPGMLCCEDSASVFLSWLQWHQGEPTVQFIKQAVDNGQVYICAKHVLRTGIDVVDMPNSLVDHRVAKMCWHSLRTLPFTFKLTWDVVFSAHSFSLGKQTVNFCARIVSTFLQFCG